MTADVLVVDDDEDIRSLLFDHFPPAYAVETASDGEEAWRTLRDRADDPPSVVVADVMMPKLDGFRLLSRMRDDERFADVPVVMLTSRGRESDVEAALDGGATDYVTKPFVVSDLVDRVERCLGEQPQTPCQ